MTDLIEYGRELVQNGEFIKNPSAAYEKYEKKIKEWLSNTIDDSEENIQHLSSAYEVLKIMRFNVPGMFKPHLCIYGDNPPQYVLDRRNINAVFNDKQVHGALTHTGRGAFANRDFARAMLKEMLIPTDYNHPIHEMRLCAEIAQLELPVEKRSKLNSVEKHLLHHALLK